MSGNTDCPFCSINWHKITTRVTLAGDGHDFAIIEPLNPVTPGHELVIPAAHVADATVRTDITAETMRIAALRVRALGVEANIITSIGPAATQTVRHLHVHIVPRYPGDGLTLPWTGQHHTPRGVDNRTARTYS